MTLTFEEGADGDAIRVDLAWELFFGSKSAIPEGHGGRLIPFTNWFWDELGKRGGRLNRDARRELTLAIPVMDSRALDFLVRLASFWADDIRLKKRGRISHNLWKKPVINVFDDKSIKGSERSLTSKRKGSTHRFLMPLLGPGRAFFRVEVIEKGASTARYHSHSGIDEYYLILDGSGTLRYNDKDVVVGPGDLIGKPTGPDATSQIIADRGEVLRVLDMEVWLDRPYFSKDVLVNQDFNEIILKGPGWGALFPMDALITSEDFRKHFGEGYRRTKRGGWVPSKLRGHAEVRKD
jgi:mannose-6-phosphate isomerase-like protein (cupin superfamily)